MRRINKLLHEPILKSLINLAVPIIIANLLQTAYQLTDTFWVGRLGVEAVAAVSISFPVLFLIMSIIGGITAAGEIMVAQYKGRGDKKTLNHIASQTLLLTIILSLFLTIMGYFLSPLLINLMGAERTVFLDAVSYLKVSFAGLIFLFTYITFQSLMRGIGDVKTPAYIILSTVLLNFILDPLFIFGYGIIPGYGVLGAAIATICTQGLSAIIGLIILLRGKREVKICFYDLKPDFNMIKQLFKLGIPVSIAQSTRAIGMALLVFLVTGFGTVIIAAYGIGVRVLSFIIIPVLGLSAATSTLVGQNIGAGKIRRAEKVAVLSSIVGFVSLTIIGVIIFFFAKQISTLFIPGDINVINSSTLFIKIMALSFGFIGVSMALNGFFRGYGNTIISMALSIISLWVLRVPLAYILSKYTSLAEVGLWITFPISNIVAAVIAVILFVKGSWKKNNLVMYKTV